jgi:hypothetical protein
MATRDLPLLPAVPGTPSGTPSGSGADELRGDCARCAGLCCVVLGFARSADFAEDKPAGTPCRNLAADFRCRIHAACSSAATPGCTAYDCFGAGPAHHRGDVRRAGLARRPGDRRGRWPTAFACCAGCTSCAGTSPPRWPCPRAGAAAPRPGRARAAELARLCAADEASPGWTRAPCTAWSSSPCAGPGGWPRTPPTHRPRSRRPPPPRRAHAGPPRADLSGRDLIGADLPRADLRGADLRGALLLAADLRGARLDRADLIGADLRDADLRGADLAGALFLTRFQLGAARGDATTVLPSGLERPVRWGAAQPPNPPAAQRLPPPDRSAEGDQSINGPSR